LNSNVIKEVNFKAIKSSGPGGQHVNKTASKIELSFDVLHSKILTDDQKKLLVKNIANRLTKDGILILQCDDNRSQHKNKEIVIKRFLQLVEKGLTIPKKRKSTKPTKASVKKRLENKKNISIKKYNRKKPDLDF